jgi:hypothetical protein
LQIDGRFHGRGAGTSGVNQVITASSERRDRGEPKRAAQQPPGSDRAGALAIALGTQVRVQLKRTHDAAIASS